MRFVINDEKSINDKGYRILTDGIDLTRFEKNPICLAFHSSSWLPVGSWRLEKKGGILYGDLTFDEKDEFAVRLKSKYEGGFMRGTSVGIAIHEINAVNLATRTELYEISLVVIPSNKASVRLSSSLKSNKMKLVAKALGLAEESEDVAVVAINKLHAQIAELEQAKRERLLNGLIEKGVISESGKSLLSAHSITDLQAVYDKAPAKKVSQPMLKDQLSTTSALSNEVEDYAYLEKKNPKKLLGIKTNQPQEYQKLVSAYLNKK